MAELAKPCLIRSARGITMVQKDHPDTAYSAEHDDSGSTGICSGLQGSKIPDKSLTYFEHKTASVGPPHLN